MGVVGCESRDLQDRGMLFLISVVLPLGSSLAVKGRQPTYRSAHLRYSDLCQDLLSLSSLRLAR